MNTHHLDLPASTATDDPAPADTAEALKARISAAIGQALADNPCATGADARDWLRRADAQAGAAQGTSGHAPLLILRRTTADSRWWLTFRHEGVRLDLSTRTRSLTKARAVRAEVLAGVLAGRFATTVEFSDAAGRVQAILAACERARAKPDPA